MKETDQKYYERKAIREAKHRNILNKASNRGQVAVEWYKHNILTKETLPSFQRAMKEADKKWEAIQLRLEL